MEASDLKLVGMGERVEFWCLVVTTAMCSFFVKISNIIKIHPMQH